MRASIYLLISLVFAGMLAGCGSPASTNAGNASNRANTASSTGTNAANAPAPGQPLVPGDPNLPPGISGVPVDPNAANTAPNGTVDLSNRRKVVDTPGGQNLKPMGVPALEDSEMITTMGKHGEFIETRVFKSHPQLAKVEITMSSPESKVTKIYLRNGKVVTVPSDQIKQINTESTARLLELAGVKGPAPSTGRPAGKTPQ